MTIKKYRTPKYFGEKSGEYAKKYNLKENPDYSGMDDEIDAFRHAYMQAYITVTHGKDAARVIGDIYEKWGDYTESQTPKQRNMDLWNNDIGRQIGEEVKNETKYFQHITSEKMFEDMIAEKIYQKMKKGEMITTPKDPRKYEDVKDGKLTGGAAQVDSYTYDFTREDIGGMSSKEFEEHEKEIMNQLKTVGVPSEIDLPKGEKSRYSNEKSKGSSSNSSSSSDGKWVTINGNHVLIKD